MMVPGCVHISMTKWWALARKQNSCVTVALITLYTETKIFISHIDTKELRRKVFLNLRSITDIKLFHYRKIWKKNFLMAILQQHKKILFEIGTK